MNKLSVCMLIISISSLGLMGCGNNAAFSQPEILEKSSQISYEIDETEYFEVTDCQDFTFEGFQFKATSITFIYEDGLESMQMTFPMDRMVDSRDMLEGMKMYPMEGVQYNQIRINVDLEQSFLWGDGLSLSDFKSGGMKNTGLKMHFDSVQETTAAGVNMQMSEDQVSGSFHSNKNWCFFKPNFNM